MKDSTIMPPKNRPTKTARKRKRKPPQKNPPRKKNPFLRYLSIIVIAGALLASGYLIGSKKSHHDLIQTREASSGQDKPPQHQQKKQPPGTITLTQAPKPKKQPSAMEILQYGFDEDARGDNAPDISWYVPNQHNKPAQTTQPKQPASTVSAPSKGGRPRLAIIIDDVSHKEQIDAIKSLPYHITPSIFPPSELSKTSNQLTRYVRHYMVHLPMESGSAVMNRMQGMLFARFSREKMQARVDAIRRLFPQAKFINNHTGSVFTSRYKAMKQLYGMLRKKGFVFVDSRTSGKSVVRSIAHAYHDPYIARDVFLDNVQNQAAILKQLKYAVRIARKRGFAIAIGHPHKATMNALRHAGKILKGVQTVYIDELYPNL